MKPLDVAIELGVAHSLYADEYRRAWTDIGGHVPAGICVENFAPPLPQAALLPLIRPYLRRLEQAWAAPLPRLLGADMGLKKSEWEEAILRTFMACMGHGISLLDDHGKALERAERILGRTIRHAPFDSEFVEFLHTAEDTVQQELEKCRAVGTPVTYFPGLNNTVTLDVDDPIRINGADLRGETVYADATFVGTRNSQYVVQVAGTGGGEGYLVGGMLVLVDLDEITPLARVPSHLVG